MRERLRLAVVASHPIQYQAPWYAALARAVDLQVLYCHRQDSAGQAAAGFDQEFEWDVPLFDGYDFRWLENVASHPGVNTFRGCDTPRIGAVLDQGRFDACLVNGWYLKSYVQAARACRQRRIPVLVRGDSQLKTPRPLVKRLAKHWPYRWFLSRFDAHLYVGRANYAYLRHYGVEERRLFFAPHFIDTKRFAAGALHARATGAAASLRANLGVSGEDCVFLFVGKLISQKRPLDFVDAVSRLAALGVRAQGVVVGSGPMDDEVRRKAAACGAAIRFLGFQNQSKMPECYAAADCLVLPSESETWGLVVNEAMACGLPAIVSDAVGCADDMIIEGETGFTFPSGNVTRLTDRMQSIANLRARNPNHFARALTDRLTRYSCERAVAGTLHALNFVSGQAAERPGTVVSSRT